MMHSRRMIPLCLALAGALPALAQESWDAHLKLSAGLMSGAEEARIGQNKHYALSLAGAYGLSRKGSAVFEVGYRVFPTTSVNAGASVVDDKTDIFFGSALYRHHLVRDGLYLQAGIRMNSARVSRDLVYPGAGANGGNAFTRIKGERYASAGWVAGVGYRLTELWSFEVGASSAQIKNVAGETKKGTLLEVALCLHR